MGRVYRTLRVTGVKGSAEAKALFDTGASGAFVRADLAEDIGYSKFPGPREVLTAAEGKSLKVVGMASFETEIGGRRTPWAPAHVSPELVEEMIIGVDLMEAHNIKIDPKTGKIDVSEFAELMILPL